MTDQDRVPPDACTLPTAEQPLRLAEFDDLFATALRGSRRVGPTEVLLDLTPTAEVASTAANLMVRENECCSFFTFDLTASGGELSLRITVPATYTDVLDGLVAGAAA